MVRQKVVTLSQFISDEQDKFPGASGDLSKIFRDIKFASKVVNQSVRKAGLADILGEHGTVNVQGEHVKKLDMIANDEFINSLSTSGDCCAIISEENEDIIQVNPNGKYIVAMDPLDGSSNIDVNVSIGTIFSIMRRSGTVGQEVGLEECLQKGSKQIAGGYVIFGSSTMLVYTTGQGVNGFTLDEGIGDFCLSHPDMCIPQNGKYYSINEGNLSSYPKGYTDYVNFCKQIDSDSNRPYSARYIGSMVADIHRNLLKGGVFMYAETAGSPNGKLRLMYECNPISFLIEQAGGKASNGTERIMDIVPTNIHQRMPIIIGSTNMVDEVISFL
jgi:fructose-1,6-bisphosphatase I